MDPCSGVQEKGRSPEAHPLKSKNRSNVLASSVTSSKAPKKSSICAWPCSIKEKARRLNRGFHEGLATSASITPCGYPKLGKPPKHEARAPARRYGPDPTGGYPRSGSITSL